MVLAIGEYRFEEICDAVASLPEGRAAEQDGVDPQSLVYIRRNQFVITCPVPTIGDPFDAIPIQGPTIPAGAENQRVAIAGCVVIAVDGTDESDAKTVRTDVVFLFH